MRGAVGLPCQARRASRAQPLDCNYRNNVAAGSDHTGFLYRLPDAPEGSGSTLATAAFYSTCPRFTAMPTVPIGSSNGSSSNGSSSNGSVSSGGFASNTAHSALLYGLRVHPEYFPRASPCSRYAAPLQQAAAVFDGLTAFKCGLKGAAASVVSRRGRGAVGCEERRTGSEHANELLVK